MDYIIDKSRLLGRGITSEVYYGFNNITNKEIAVKIVSKKTKNIKFYIENEIQNLKILQSEINIIKLLDHYETETDFILIFEYVELTLSQYIKKGISNRIIKDIILQLISVIEILRKNNIVHHDIKPDNILVEVNKVNSVNIKLCDFGMSILTGKSSHNKLCGSPLYMHTSKLLYNYNFNSDEWSVNIIFYELVYGENPYKGVKTKTEIIKNIDKNIIYFPYSNVFTPLLKKIFYSNGRLFISLIKNDIQKLDISEHINGVNGVENGVNEEINVEEIEKEYVFV
jgi:serine/threonine protein kinase